MTLKWATDERIELLLWWALWGSIIVGGGTLAYFGLLGGPT